MQRYKIYGKTGKVEQTYRRIFRKGYCLFYAGISQSSFPEMIEKLRALTEEDWGKYAFSREPLEGRFSDEQKMQYTHKANDCGREWAEKIARQYGTRNPGEIS